nr:hypothetical protein [Sphingopyxis sp. PET50]
MTRNSAANGRLSPIVTMTRRSSDNGTSASSIQRRCAPSPLRTRSIIVPISGSTTPSQTVVSEKSSPTSATAITPPSAI